MGAVIVQREPHIELRRTHSSGSHAVWCYSVVVGDRITSGRFEGPIDARMAWRRVLRVLRRPQRQVWTQMTRDQRVAYMKTIGGDFGAGSADG